MDKKRRVICINDTIDPAALIEISNDFQQWVKMGKIYHIREHLDNDGIVDGYLLEEIRNRPVFLRLINRVQEPAFATWRFRELSDDELMAMVREKIETIKL